MAYAGTMQDWRTTKGDLQMSYGFAGLSAQSTNSGQPHAEWFVRDLEGALIARVDRNGNEADRYVLDMTKCTMASMDIEEAPEWHPKWHDQAVYGCFLWAEDGALDTWYRLVDCGVTQALDWSASTAGDRPYSLGLLVSDPTEAPSERDGLIWLLGADGRHAWPPRPREC